jgi:hypothetical protein
MTPTEVATRVDVANAEDVRAAVDAILEHAGVSLEELKRQAAASQFSSERARLAWFMISSVAGGH